MSKELKRPFIFYLAAIALFLAPPAVWADFSNQHQITLSGSSEYGGTGSASISVTKTGVTALSTSSATYTRYSSGFLGVVLPTGMGSTYTSNLHSNVTSLCTTMGCTGAGLLPAIEWPDMALITAPPTTGESELGVSINAPACPFTTATDYTFFATQFSSRFAHDFTSSSQPAVGKISWLGKFIWPNTNATGRADLVSFVSLGTPSSPTLSSRSMGGTCSGSAYTITGAGDGGGSIYATAHGLIYKTNANNMYFALPQVALTDLSQISGKYSGFMYEKGSGVTPVYLDFADDGNSGTIKTVTNLSNLDSGSTWGGVAFSSANSPYPGTAVGTITRLSGGSGNLVCGFSTRVGGKTVAICSAQTPGNNSVPMVLLLNSVDIVGLSISNPIVLGSPISPPRIPYNTNYWEALSSAGEQITFNVQNYAPVAAQQVAVTLTKESSPGAAPENLELNVISNDCGSPSSPGTLAPFSACSITARFDSLPLDSGSSGHYVGDGGENRVQDYTLSVAYRSRPGGTVTKTESRAFSAVLTHGGTSIDPDGDGVATIMDNCPNDSNASQVDFDADGEGDECDTSEPVSGGTPVAVVSQTASSIGLTPSQTGTVTYSIRNVSPAQISFSSPAFNGGAIGMDCSSLLTFSPSPFSLAPGESTTISASFLYNEAENHNCPFEFSFNTDHPSLSTFTLPVTTVHYRGQSGLMVSGYTSASDVTSSTNLTAEIHFQISLSHGFMESPSFYPVVEASSPWLSVISTTCSSPIAHGQTCSTWVLIDTDAAESASAGSASAYLRTYTNLADASTLVDSSDWNFTWTWRYDQPLGDRDSDGVVNGTDNCPEVYNTEQNDSDMDGIGNACDEPDPTPTPTESPSETPTPTPTETPTPSPTESPF